MSTDEYDALADMSASIEFCYRAIRERMARGGPQWVPPQINEIPAAKPATGQSHATDTVDAGPGRPAA